MKKKHKFIIRVISWILFIIYLVRMVYFLFFSEMLGRTFRSDTYHYNLKRLRRFRGILLITGDLEVSMFF